MKKIKFYITVLIFPALFAGVFAQQQDPIERGIDNYLMALKSNNPGLVESAIINIIKMKMVHPQRDYSKIMDQLDRLTQRASKKYVRYEAYIALGYLQYPENFNWIQVNDDQPINNLLGNLVVKIHEQTEGVK